MAKKCVDFSNGIGLYQSRPKSTIPRGPRHLQMAWSVGPTNSDAKSCVRSQGLQLVKTMPPARGTLQLHLGYQAACRTHAPTGPGLPRHL
ncbi:hypothetical protein V6N11_033764 [Hibiscus sabdariffa]|uniref:Uncharacterized protein n=1 Tax=Hibiscus sabdariffa TaxID=183260 RepID=A0ABR2S0I4_9ROSI